MYGPQIKSMTVFKSGSSGNRLATRSSASYRMGDKSRLKPLPYSMYWTYSEPVAKTQFTGDAGDAPNTFAAYYGSTRPDLTQATNKALDKFVGSFKGGTDASLAVTLAEWQQSHQMIVARSAQLLSAFRNLRKLRLGDAAKDLGLSKKQVKDVVSRQGAKNTAGQWLELHFGWVPLIQDIHNAVEVLQGPLPHRKARGSSVSSESVVDNPGKGDWNTEANFVGFVKIQADVHLVNPNLALANRLGLINPATVAWELVPFSFLVDWFLPVGNFLNSFTDFVGYEVTNPCTTTLRKSKSKQVYINDDVRYQQWSLGEAVYMSRVLSIPARRLVMNSFKGLSLSRGATAISLVIQQFLPLTNRR